MIILLGSQKGGCGKSTLATNLSAALATFGKDVVLVDADRQGTSAAWAADRAEQTTLPAVAHVRLYDNIRSQVLDLAQRYEVVVVDSSGRDSRELRTGAVAANILLVPFRPSQADLDTMPSLAKVIQAAQDLNPDLKCMSVLTMAHTNPSVKEAEEGRGYIAEFPELPLAKTMIHDRKIYRDALSEGKGVVESDNIKAKEEIFQLLEEVLNGQNT